MMCGHRLAWSTRRSVISSPLEEFVPSLIRSGKAQKGFLSEIQSFEIEGVSLAIKYVQLTPHTASFEEVVFSQLVPIKRKSALEVRKRFLSKTGLRLQGPWLEAMTWSKGQPGKKELR